MSKTKVVVGFYGVLVATFVVLIVFFSYTKEDTIKNERSFVRFTTLSDAVVCSGDFGIRFYSLVATEEMISDPILPLNTKNDFLYKVKK